MLSERFSLHVSEGTGSVSASYTTPENPVCIMTLAHGAGANMDHSFMVALSEALAAVQVATLRFNFPFMEGRKGRPDLPAVAHKTVAAAMNHAGQEYPSLPLFLSGKSFGGRMSSQFLAFHPDANVAGIVFYGFPLHPPKKPSIDRADHLKDIKQPMLFLQGTRDELAEWSLIENVTTSLPSATLIKLDGADHAFKAGKQNLVPVLAEHTKNWIVEKIKGV